MENKVRQKREQFYKKYSRSNIYMESSSGDLFYLPEGGAMRVPHAPDFDIRLVFDFHDYGFSRD